MPVSRARRGTWLTQLHSKLYVGHCMASWQVLADPSRSWQVLEDPGRSRQVLVDLLLAPGLAHESWTFSNCSLTSLFFTCLPELESKRSPNSEGDEKETHGKECRWDRS